MESYSQSDHLTTRAASFLNSLKQDQRSFAVYNFNNEERFNWHFFPKADRKGIAFKALNEQQKKELVVFLEQCLSTEGVRQSLGIVQLEGILRDLENRKQSDEYRDPGKYYFIFFGEPSTSSIWGWRLEGHHLSLNFSAIGNKIVAVTPAFMGSNPAIVRSGPAKGLQVLKKEEENAFKLLSSLSKEQLIKTVYSNQAPNDILTFVSRKASLPDKSGIKYSELDKNQQELLIELIETYIGRYTKLFALQMMNELKQEGLDQLRFAWAGSLQAGEGHYYRITGPTILIEYDNTQNNANHVHSVVRDLKRDFGGDELIEHYNKSHKATAPRNLP